MHASRVKNKDLITFPAYTFIVGSTGTRNPALLWKMYSSIETKHVPFF